MHSNPHFSNFPTEISNEKGEATLLLGGLTAYLKVVRKLFDVHHFILNFFHILLIQCLCYYINNFTLNRQLKSMIQRDSSNLSCDIMALSHMPIFEII